MAQNFTYTQCGDYYIPDIKLSYTSTQALGKYGRMRRAFLEQNKPMLFNDMILTESLFPHLREVQQTCEKRMELLMTDLLGKNPAPDKATQQLAWVAHMNPDYVVRITGSDDYGKKKLDYFISVSAPYPVIATTSKLLYFRAF